jgi:hypothetical protein
MRTAARTLRVGQAAGPEAAVDAGQAFRLLVLADLASRFVDGAVALGERPGASAADKAAAVAVLGCADVLTRAAGPFDALVSELRASLSSGSPARISAAQAAALDAFVACAAAAERAYYGARTRGGILEAIVGTAVPAAAALLVAL